MNEEVRVLHPSTSGLIPVIVKMVSVKELAVSTFRFHCW